MNEKDEQKNWSVVNPLTGQVYLTTINKTMAEKAAANFNAINSDRLVKVVEA